MLLLLQVTSHEVDSILGGLNILIKYRIDNNFPCLQIHVIS